MQDVSITVDLTCAPAGSFRDQIPIGDIPIAADGSFTSVTTQENLVGINPASYTYTFKGRFTGNTVAGTMREDVTYNDGVARVCTSGERAFTADRDADQGTQQILAPGSYSGTEYGLLRSGSTSRRTAGTCRTSRSRSTSNARPAEPTATRSSSTTS